MKPHVLIVDDSLTVRMDLSEAFLAAGFDATVAEDLATARAAVARGAFAVVVLDVLLPDGDGLALLKELKAAVVAVPVVLLSSEAEVRDRIAGLRTGADDYVGKPYDSGYVVARARELVRREAPVGPRGAPTVLVIDDSATFRDLLREAFEAAGYSVLLAASGEEGLRVAAASIPDAVVVDGLLPGISGPTVIRRIKSDAALQRIPCLLLTASSMAEDADELRALEAGADAYVRKVQDTSIILARLTALLRRGQASAPLAAASTLLGPKRLLAVDDSVTFLQELASQLRGEGYDVVLARSGEAALELLTVQPVDAILLDMSMPGLSGPETCARIKGSPAWREIPVLILTAHDGQEAMLEGINAGADDYISKTSDFEVLKARLWAQIRRRQFEDENRRIREELLRRERDLIEARAAHELAELRATQAEELQARQEELDRFFSLSLDLMCVVGFDGYLKRLNPAWSEILGFTEAELLARPFIELIHPDDREATLAEFTKNTNGKITVSFENRYRCRDGTYRWLLWSAAAAPEQGIICATARDNTERRRAEERLRAQTAELMRQTEELTSQGEELFAQQRELEAKNVEIERSSRLKSEFLANMSHELRTPLNAVIGFSELLLDNATTRLERAEVRYVEDILASGRHLLNLINDILDLVKIEAGRVTLKLEPIEAEDAIADAVALVQPAARKKRIRVETRVLATRPALADQRRLRQILLNLFSNAIKFSPEGTSIHVNAEDRGELVRFTVRDEGPGMDEALLAQLFQPFVQGESPLVKTHQGTGLGLAISRGLVEQHGGTIEVASRLGSGSTFAFTLLAAPGSPGQAPEPPPARLEPVVPAAPSRRVSGTPLVLVVEDNPASANLVRAWLSERGYEVAETNDGARVAAMAESLQPCVILLDLVLEGMDGLRALEDLKRRPETRNIPVVITSVLDEKKRGMALGAADYLSKPLDRADLLARMAATIPRPADGKPLVLAIDDDAHVGEVLRGTLEPAGYRFVAALTGRDGLARARAMKPALIISDLVLPDISGFEVVEELARHEATRDIPVFVLTARDLGEAHRERLKKHVRALAEKGDLTREALLAAVGAATRAPSPPDATRTGPTVLVVDDHDMNRAVVRAILERRGYRVLDAEDGQVAIEITRRERPALVLMDLAMPRKDGFTAARELKSDPETRAIPILALTALAMRSDEERARQAGFDGYLTKPIDRAALEEAVAAFLSKGRLA
jgi:PAS domain S-box-containing protein